MKTLTKPLKNDVEVTASIIKRRSGLSDAEYNELQFDAGRDFIRRLFDVEGYDDMIEFYLQDSASRFWTFWKRECQNQERILFHEMQALRSQMRLSPHYIYNLITSSFRQMVTSNRVEASFQNHIKQLYR